MELLDSRMLAVVPEMCRPGRHTLLRPEHSRPVLRPPAGRFLEAKIFQTRPCRHDPAWVEGAADSAHTQQHHMARAARGKGGEASG